MRLLAFRREAGSQSLAPLLEYAAVEIVFRTDDAVYLGCGEDLQKAVVVLFLQFLDLKVVLVMPADGGGTGFLVGSVDVTKLLVLVKNGHLLLPHLTVYGKEARRLYGRQASLNNDKAFKVGLELLGIEPAFLGIHGRYTERQQE